MKNVQVSDREVLDYLNRQIATLKSKADNATDPRVAEMYREAAKVVERQQAEVVEGCMRG